MNKIKRLKDLALYEYFVKIDDQFVDITKELIINNSEKLEEINNLQQENKQLKERIKKVEDYASKVGDRRNELYDKIDKAIEYIVKNCILSDEWTDLDFCNFIPTGKITYKQLTPKKVKELLAILGDKE